MKIAALILAAGSSKRMGETKQLMKFGSSTLLGTVVQNVVTSSVDEVFCVLGAKASEIEKSIAPYRSSIIINQHYRNGLGTSIAKGVEVLEHKDCQAVLIILGDQPLVGKEYLNSIVTAFHDNPSHIIATKYHHQLGVPALFPRKYFPGLLALEGDKGAKEFLKDQKDQVITLDHDRLMDVDTPKDYQELLKKWKS